MRNFRRFIQAGLLLGLHASCCMAAECLVIGQGGQAAIQVNGKPQPLPALLSTCDAVKVAKGTVVACTQDRRGRQSCRSFPEGRPIQLDQARSPEGSGWMTKLRNVLAGSEASVAAVSRGALSVLPEGQVLLVTPEMRLEATPGQLDEGDEVEFRTTDVDGPLVAHATVQNGELKLSNRRFKAGMTYWWVVRNKGGTMKGSSRFSTAPSAQMKLAQAEHKRLLQSTDGDRLAAAALFAAWLAEREFPFDVLQVLKSAELSEGTSRVDTTQP